METDKTEAEVMQELLNAAHRYAVSGNYNVSELVNAYNALKYPPMSALSSSAAMTVLK